MTLRSKFKAAAVDVLPRPALLAAKRLVNSGRGPTCVVCGTRVRAFRAQGYDYPVLVELDVVGGQRKPSDECPICHANDRTRLVYLYILERTPLLTERNRLLHIAPEMGLADLFTSAPNLDYVPADLDRRRYRHLENLKSFDLQDIPFPDADFDWVICNHVLEHVPDDRRAMREILRILSPGGTAILQVPIARKLTHTREDPLVEDEAERISRFGQRDHLRLYGRDYYDRLIEAGFTLELWDAFQAQPERAAAWRLDPAERLTLARRAPT